jgi:rSAM/selenodomain-associated transferase 2
MISVIIPVLNEEKVLSSCLQSLFAQTGDYEVILVDGGSTDNTREIASRFDLHIEQSAKSGRAIQMNAGASKACGDWLVFLHADTHLPDFALEHIESLTSSLNIQAGCFKHQFSGKHFLLKAISWLHNWRCRRSRVIYGDQCLFLRRELFAKLGGFPDTEILEDVMLSEAIIEISKPIILCDAVITDSRKFERRGIIRSFAEIFLIMSCYELGLPIKGRGFFSPTR